MSFLLAASLTRVTLATKMVRRRALFANLTGGVTVRTRGHWSRIVGGAAWLAGCLAWAAGLTLARADDVPSPLEPPDTLSRFQLDDGLKIELVACEPQVVDPVAIRFDEDGRLWVVEMRDYPHGPDEGQPPLSKIRLLADQDGDGRYETSQVFAEDLLFPTGVQPWQGGVIVTLAGEVAYLKDTDGDGRADVRETWYRGFTQENPQLRANHPRLGLDNRVYVANGLRGGTVHDPRREGAAEVSISGRDFRFNPRDGVYEAISGNGQFGLTLDDYGNRFVCSNRQPLDHVVLENQYLARNPFLAVPAVLNPVAAAGEHSRVYPLTSAWTTSNLHAGQFTAACGVDIYRGNALGDAYRGNALVCEPTGSLVHREIVSPDGVTFTSKPAAEGREFLASPDAWFRPVNLEVGPEGALYVVDMYRAVIEHPQFMPSELQERPDLRLGDARGRIYRIVPRNFKHDAQRPKLSASTTDELVQLLEHNNAWQRETAARLIYERQETAAMPALEKLASQGKTPLARIHALWALKGLQALSKPTVAAALVDAHPRVREQAIVLAERLLSGDDDLRERVVQLADDEDARVQFRAVFALGGLTTDEVIRPLATAALRRADDPWMRRAVASALPHQMAPVLLAILRSDAIQSGRDDPAARALVQELAAVVGARQAVPECVELVGFTCDADVPNPTIRDTALLGLCEGLTRRGKNLTELLGMLRTAQPEQKLQAAFERAAGEALDTSLDEATRQRKLELLRHARGERVTAACLEIVGHAPSQSLRVLAAKALAPQADETTAETLLAEYSEQTPAVRRAIHDALAVQPKAAGALLDAVQAGTIARAELGPACENRLKQHRNEDVRRRAAKILAASVPAERKAVLADYRQALALSTDPAAGKQLFRQHCATCHHIDDVGVDVAPDISDSRVKTPEQLLTDILNPNQAIDNNYVSYTVVTADGNVHTGIIAAETAASVTLRQPENKTLTLLRADIEVIRSSGVSLMPEGFEKHLSHQQAADLIAFVKNWRYLDKPIPARIAPGEQK